MTDKLDADLIADGVLPTTRPMLRRVTVLEEIDSTNAELDRMSPGERHAHAVLAERQTKGRGRRKRNWHSPAGGNLYFSLGWRFPRTDLPFSTLPLVVAIAVASTLKKAGLERHGIKWPNDILVGGRKLVGILAELKSGASSTSAVIGVGINVHMPAKEDEDPVKLIDRPWTDLESQLDETHRPCDRNRLASSLLDNLLASLDRYERGGFESFRDAWNTWDLLRNGQVTLELDENSIVGTADGVNEQGELVLKTANGDTRAFHAGEVRVYRGIRTF